MEDDITRLKFKMNKKKEKSERLKSQLQETSIELEMNSKDLGKYKEQVTNDFDNEMLLMEKENLAQELE